MALRIYDTQRRTKVEFVPRDTGRVSMYVCGPTVYNHIHIGNARTFLSFDVIRRYLEHLYGEQNVTFVRNITDVDDKIIGRAAEEGRTPEEVAKEYTVAFHEAMDALGVKAPSVEPLATETIDDMIAMVHRLIEKGHAYEIGGDVYFSVRSFSGYGKLSGRDIDDLRCGARVEIDDRKRDPLDFALWKSAKPGEPHWKSPWGEGRPGWHLECSVMATGSLGESFDIHGGGADLIFPHHENEVAQAEADTGKPFARYWMHGGMLQINQEKMSKSLGNFTLLKDVIERYPAPVIRLLMLQTHYRSPLDFSDARLDESSTAFERLLNPGSESMRLKVMGAGNNTEPTVSDVGTLREAVDSTQKRFESEMQDDFNTAGALGAIFSLVTVVNRFMAEFSLGATDDQFTLVEEAVDMIEGLLAIVGIDLGVEPIYPSEVLDASGELTGYVGTDPKEATDALRLARDDARSAKDWAKADEIRDRLAALGFEVKDTPQGTDVVPPRG